MGTLAGQERLAPGKPRPDTRARRRARARRVDRIMTALLWGLAAVLAAVLVYFIGYTLIQGIAVLSPQFIFSTQLGVDTVAPQLFNTFYIIGLALVICIPIAVGAAIYLVEYAKQNLLTTALRFATETLAGVPSIVLGLFGFLLFVTSFGSGHLFGFSRLAGALTLTLLNLPLLLRVSEDALRSVPGELREASMALGANKFKTVGRVLLPAALPGLTTGVILTAGKMIGETAALIYTAGSNAAGGPNSFSLDPLLPGETLTVHLYQLHAEGLARNAQALQNGTAALLIALLLIFNIGLRYLASLLNRRLSGRR